MTTDITELAQREKFEAWAEHACAAPWGYLKKRRTTEGYSEQIYTCMWTAWKAASAELVEALEKAQQRIDELQQGFIANQEEAHEAIKYATELKEQLARACAGREEAFREVDEMQKSLDHTHRRRTIWRGRAVTAEAEIAALRQRIAELESFRTAYMEWSDKTYWVQTDKRFDVLKPWGKHRADVLKAYIEHLESRTFTAAAVDVLAERQRQVTTEGWAPAHDDEYEHGELADAAGCYALSSELFDCAGEPPRPWPWPDEWWKPTSRRRDLVKAGALILAEIERIDRAAGVDVREAE